MRHITTAVFLVGLSTQMALAFTPVEGEERKLLTPAESSVPVWVKMTIDEGDQVGRGICKPFLAAMELTNQISLTDCLIGIAGINGRNQLDVISVGDELWLPAMDNNPSEVQTRLAVRLQNKALSENPLGQVVQGLIAEVSGLKESQLTEARVNEIVTEKLAAGKFATQFEVDETESSLLKKINEAVTIAPPAQTVVTQPVTLIDLPQAQAVDTPVAAADAGISFTTLLTAPWQEYLPFVGAVLALIALMGVGHLSRTKATKKSVAEVRVETADAKRLALVALDTATFSCELQMQGFKFIGDPPSQAVLDELKPNQSFKVRLREEDYVCTIKFSVEPDPFKTGKYGLRVEGFPGQTTKRSAIAMRREQVAKVIGEAIVALKREESVTVQGPREVMIAAE